MQNLGCIISHFPLTERMTNSQRLAKVRTRFLNWMLDVHHDQSTADSNRPLIRRESMLIRDEFFCGRRFHSDQYDAIWFIEEDVFLYDINTIKNEFRRSRKSPYKRT